MCHSSLFHSLTHTISPFFLQEGKLEVWVSFVYMCKHETVRLLWCLSFSFSSTHTEIFKHLSNKFTHCWLSWSQPDESLNFTVYQSYNCFSGDFPRRFKFLPYLFRVANICKILLRLPLSFTALIEYLSVMYCVDFIEAGVVCLQALSQIAGRRDLV